MGQHADDIYDMIERSKDYLIDIEKFEKLKRKFIHEAYSKGTLYWTMKNGETILIQDMTRSHKVNTLNLLKRKTPNSPYIEVFENELKKS